MVTLLTNIMLRHNLSTRLFQTLAGPSPINKKLKWSSRTKQKSCPRIKTTIDQTAIDLFQIQTDGRDDFAKKDVRLKIARNSFINFP